MTNFLTITQAEKLQELGVGIDTEYIYAIKFGTTWIGKESKPPQLRLRCDVGRSILRDQVVCSAPTCVELENWLWENGYYELIHESQSNSYFNLSKVAADDTGKYVCTFCVTNKLIAAYKAVKYVKQFGEKCLKL